MRFEEKSFFAKQLQEIANSGADGQAQAERIRSLLELQRQAHAQLQQTTNAMPFAGKCVRLAPT